MSALSDQVTGPRIQLRGDFHRLWGAYSVSELGSALGAGALPLLAVLVLDVSAFQVAALAAISAIAAAAIALPLGSFVEFRRKRPIMIIADLLRFAALGSVPLLASVGLLTYMQLCVVGVIQTTCNIVFGAASGAHLKALVPSEQRLEANSRFETTYWTATSAGPPLGGLLISWLGATSTPVIDAVSFLLSALGIRTLRTPEPPPPVMRESIERVHERRTASETRFCVPWAAESRFTTSRCRRRVRRPVRPQAPARLALVPATEFAANRWPLSHRALP